MKSYLALWSLILSIIPIPLLKIFENFYGPYRYRIEQATQIPAIHFIIPVIIIIIGLILFFRAKKTIEKYDLRNRKNLFWANLLFIIDIIYVVFIGGLSVVGFID